MIDASKFSKLTVGDIAEYELWRREARKKELIAITKELYGDQIPSDSVAQIEQELRKIPSLTDDNGVDITAANYLIWKSIQKNDPDITIRQVSQNLDVDKIEEYMEKLFPADTTIKKKQVKRKISRKKLTR